MICVQQQNKVKMFQLKLWQFCGEIVYKGNDSQENRKFQLFFLFIN